VYRPHRTECLKTTDNNREPKTLVAYPLWIAIAAAAVITALRGLRLARRAAPSAEEPMAAG
jgi:hypothetical protein